MNLRPHGPEPCALPNCATPRFYAAAAALSVSRKDRAYHKRHPLPDTEIFDMLILRDQKKKQHHYAVSAADFHDVLAFIREYQPEAVFRPDKTI